MAEALGTYIAEVLKAATYSYEGAEIDYFEDKNGRPDKKVLAIYWEELVLQKIRSERKTLFFFPLTPKKIKFSFLLPSQKTKKKNSFFLGFTGFSNPLVC